MKLDMVILLNFYAHVFIRVLMSHRKQDYRIYLKLNKITMSDFIVRSTAIVLCSYRGATKVSI